MVIGVLIGGWLVDLEMSSESQNAEALNQEKMRWENAMSVRRVEAGQLVARSKVLVAELHWTEQRLGQLRPQVRQLEERREALLQWESILPKFRGRDGQWYQMTSWPPVVDSAGTSELVNVRRTPAP
jgi:hypothetical protein